MIGTPAEKTGASFMERDELNRKRERDKKLLVDREVDRESRQTVRAILVTWLFGIGISLAFFLMEAIFSTASQSWADRIKSGWATTASHDDSSSAIAAAWAAVPVMVFVALSVERARAGDAKDLMTLPIHERARLMTMRSVARWLYYSSAFGIWILFPLACHSDHKFTNGLFVAGAALLCSAFAALDGRDPLAEARSQLNIVRSLYSTAVTFRDCEASEFRNPPLAGGMRRLRRPFAFIFSHVGLPTLILHAVAVTFVTVTASLIWVRHGHVTANNILGWALVILVLTLWIFVWVGVGITIHAQVSAQKLLDNGWLAAVDNWMPVIFYWTLSILIFVLYILNLAAAKRWVMLIFYVALSCALTVCLFVGTRRRTGSKIRRDFLVAQLKSSVVVAQNDTGLPFQSSELITLLQNPSLRYSRTAAVFLAETVLGALYSSDWAAVLPDME